MKTTHQPATSGMARGGSAGGAGAVPPGTGPQDCAARGLDRRTFLKWCALLGGAAMLPGGLAGLCPAVAEAASGGEPQDFVWSSCNVNCGSRCVLRAMVRDGAIVRMDTDNLGADDYGTHQIRACLRGRAMRQRVYAPERLKYPMLRTGKRGEAAFRRATWDEALDVIAAKMKDIKERYGNEAFYLNYGTGNLGSVMSKSWPTDQTPITRLMNCYGGYLNHYNTYSTAQIATSMPYLYGGGLGNALSDIVNSKLVVLFGNNPAETRMSGGGVVYDIQRAKRESNVRVIVIDPRYTDTAVAVADEWIPIRPATDAALAAGIAYVLFTEGMADRSFMDAYCVGHDEAHLPEGVPAGSSYEAYITGKGPDGVAKTPGWASAICGVPVDTIVRLAREIGTAKPCCISQGWGPQRHHNGETNCRAIAVLAALTGNVGIPGGNTGAREGGFSIPFPGFPTLKNPVAASISFFLWTDAIVRGPEMTAERDGVRGVPKLNVPVKFIWNYAGNALINQHSDINRTAQILSDDTKCEMIVVVENFMTPSARFADVLLPAVTNLEENDFAHQGSTAEMGYVVFAQKAIEPLFESRSVYDMCADIAERLGVREQYTEGRTRDQWLQEILTDARQKLPDLPATLEEAWKLGVYKVRNPGKPFVAYKAFRDDPVANPLATPSGRIEIFSKRLWDIGHKWELPAGERIAALPEYDEATEGQGDPLRKKYPLQLVTHHYKQRTHSTYGNVPWLKEAAPQTVWVNPLDAADRGLAHGDMVRVFNDRGATVLPVKVTPRIMPGIISIPQGAWYTPGAGGTDFGGSANILTSLRPSPLAKGNPQHTTLVEMARHSGGSHANAS
ncbi:DMSO/selenate family reductase complex A subunit [Nitratidesulfovibrio liaohensis]|uniref:Molybdopterin-dependent oxidoreductase n=1 Tax=Nitratidesulfovibrio liaohensis TaxID=2604158 RepID=A0ABY9QXM8_9BACT|nr:DMSO/selenate family reductase complex A subunit [Nitratidesulfovibrio liaohensis]WMW63934.1 molybdopterin-dependent oxidoreductase [Nitratidesulfovibrio liaohensis]